MYPKNFNISFTPFYSTEDFVALPRSTENKQVEVFQMRQVLHPYYHAL